jgi:hypothetical protein
MHSLALAQEMEVSGQLHAPAVLTPGKEHPVPIGEEAEWAPEPVWTRCRIEKPPSPGRIRTPIIPVCVFNLSSVVVSFQ